MSDFQRAADEAAHEECDHGVPLVHECAACEEEQRNKLGCLSGPVMEQYKEVLWFRAQLEGPETDWPGWSYVERGIDAAKERIHQAVARNESWPLCTDCGKPRCLGFLEAECEKPGRLCYDIVPYWTCRGGRR